MNDYSSSLTEVVYKGHRVSGKGEALNTINMDSGNLQMKPKYK